MAKYYVASASILDPKIISQVPHLLERRKQFLSRKPSELVIYPTFSRVCIADFNLEQIKYSPKKISHINKFQFWSMIYSGSRLATFKYSLFQEKGFIYNNLRFLKHLLGYPIAPFFLPSTGMLALLIAVNKYKHEGEYILDGINPGSYISDEGKKKGAIG